MVKVEKGKNLDLHINSPKYHISFVKMSARAVGIHTMITRMSATQRLAKYMFTDVLMLRPYTITKITNRFPMTPTRKMMMYNIVDVITMYNGGSTTTVPPTSG